MSQYEAALRNDAVFCAYLAVLAKPGTEHPDGITTLEVSKVIQRGLYATNVKLRILSDHGLIADVHVKGHLRLWILAEDAEAFKEAQLAKVAARCNERRKVRHQRARAAYAEKRDGDDSEAARWLSTPPTQRIVSASLVSLGRCPGVRSVWDIGVSRRPALQQ